MSKVVFMGTPDFSVPALQTLIETQEVVGVVTQPDRPAGRGKKLRPSPVKVVAQEAGIPVYQPKSLKKEDAAAPLREWQPDVIVVAAFGQILRPHVLDLPSHGCLNVHASLLPRWRGASPIQHTLLAGDDETGVCLMQMDVGLDTGPVFVCQSTPITLPETAVTLHDRLAKMGADLLRHHLDNILSGQLSATPQNDDLSTYAPMISKKDGRINWHKTNVDLDRQIRAMTPWPGAFTTWQGVTLKILEAVLFDDRVPPGQPGQVINIAGKTVVRTANGGLQLQQVQLADKRAMSLADFLRGQPQFIGTKLGD
ncbi:MAG: methionyl-tRNA formyltransferase [Chloroflexi bacterium]|nr:methionyl-tRNA formyltransferase [Chloroflexota bacterium]